MKLLIWLFSIAALVAASAFAFVMQRVDLALISAVACLVAAQVIHVVTSRHPDEVDDDRMTGMAERIKKNSIDIEKLSHRYKDQAQRLAETVARIEKSETQRSLVSPVHPVRALPGTMPMHAQPQLAQPVAPATPTLFLEPIVRLSEGRTAYYKATLQSPGQPQQVLVSADMPTIAGQQASWGQAADLDMLRQTMPLVEKLRARRGATGIFCPLSAATLEDANALQAYVGELQTNPQGAAGIVIDLHQTTLRSLSETGMRGLAWLASLGATFCLTAEDVKHGDFASLAELGFAFIDTPMHHLQIAESTVPAGQPGMSAYARDNNIALIASGIAQAQPHLMSVASLARGSAYSPARAVKNQGGASSAATQVA